MSDNTFGLVVEGYKTDIGVWRLFSGYNCHLAKFDPSLCSDALHIGDIVQARSERNAMCISRGGPFPDSVWSDGRRVIIRTVVSFERELTMEQGTWKDETGLPSVRMLSRDIGIIVVPTNWYVREFADPNEYNLFAYVQFVPLALVNTETGERVQYFWRIVEDRIALPIIPAKDENPEAFSLPCEIRKVPALTLLRHGKSMLVWSYALGDHLAIILDYDSHKVGKWMEVTVIRSSERDLATHGCTYTVLRRFAVMPDYHPEVSMVNEAFQMTLLLNRSDPDPRNPNDEVNVWHDFWGLLIDYDARLAAWIRGEDDQFRALVQVGLSPEQVNGLRVVIKAVAPATMPRVAKGPAPPTHRRSDKDMDKLKKTLHEATRSTNNNNNGDQWPQSADQTTSTVEWDKSGSEGAVAPARNATGSGSSVCPIPIRERDDKWTEESWKVDMREKTWAWPDDIDGDGNSDSRSAVKCLSKEKTGYVQNPLRKRVIITDVSKERIKVMQCLITKVRFDAEWKEADKIQLYILDYNPGFITHEIGDALGSDNFSSLKSNPDFTTVGNVVELRVGRNAKGWNVCDDDWRLVTKVSLPMRIVSEPEMTKSLELIVIAKCLNPEIPYGHNDRFRYNNNNNKGFIMFQEETLHNICYYGRDIDARQHNDFNFQMAVAPEESIWDNVFWRATELLWRIPRSPGIPKPSPPVLVPATIRETTSEELFSIYAKLTENGDLMEALNDRTGINFVKKCDDAIEEWKQEMESDLPVRPGKDIECMENLLLSIVENSYTEGIFRVQGEKKLWKLLVTTVNTIKDWRRHNNNR